MPDRIARGVLLDPGLWVPPSHALEQAEAARAERSFATVEEAVGARIAAGTTSAPREMLEPDFRAHLERRPDGRLRLRYSRSAVVAAWGELARTPPQQRIEVPLLVAYAAEAEVCPPFLVEAYRETAGDLLESVELPGGHIVMWDAFEETAVAIEQFFCK